MPEGRLYRGGCIVVLAVRQRVELVPPGVVTSQKNHADKENDEERGQDSHHSAQDVNVGHGPGDRRRNVQRHLHVQPVIRIGHRDPTNVVAVVLLTNVDQAQNSPKDMLVLPEKAMKGKFRGCAFQKTFPISTLTS